MGEALSKQELMNKLIEESAAITPTVNSSEEQKGFIMSNSVYMSENYQTVIDSKTISSANFGATPIDAKKNAIEIYVERLAVKVTATVDNTQSNYKNLGTEEAPEHAFKVVDAPDVDGQGTDIYAKLLAWDINTTAEKSFLVKHLNDVWNASNPYQGWNDYNKSRSYFAESTSQTDYNSEFQWTGINNKFNEADYCLENTSNADYTKVLVKAQLGTLSGNIFTPQTIYQWYSVYYTSLDALREAVKTAVSEQISLDKSNISTTSLYDADDPDSYEAFQLKLGVANGTYNKPNTQTALTTDEIAAIFDALPTVKVWSTGATYYFTKIQHNDNPKINAVIRNHAYRVSIEGVKGLGTPVYIPEGSEGEEPTIPEPVLPEDTETYIAAKINVLSWKIVSNNVILGQ